MGDALIACRKHQDRFARTAPALRRRFAFTRIALRTAALHCAWRARLLHQSLAILPYLARHSYLFNTCLFRLVKRALVTALAIGNRRGALRCTTPTYTTHFDAAIPPLPFALALLF